MSLIPHSLKKQLLFFLLLATTVIWGLTTWFTYVKMQQETAELFDAELAYSAGVLHAFVESMLHEGSLSEHWDPEHASNLLHNHNLAHRYAGKVSFQLWSSEDGLILRSESAPVFSLSKNYNGFSETIIDGYLWHVFSIANNNGEYVIHVGQRDDIRKHITQEIAQHLAFVLIPGLILLGMTIWAIVSRILKPLTHLTEQLSQREANNLKPLPQQSLPEEIKPVVKQLNQLFEQLEQAFENERNFTSDASHELRTPLAGLMTQVQVAAKTDNHDIRQQALDQAQQAVIRMTRMVHQLLTLSRIQSQNQTVEFSIIDTSAEIVMVIGELEAIAHQKNISIEFISHETLKIRGNGTLFSILVRNLVENAIKYCPQGSKIKIQSIREKNMLHLSVEDNGPGIHDQNYERLTQRFYRCVETANKAEGSGLGLSIVQRSVALHEAKIYFSKSTMGGLKALVIFPLMFDNPKHIKKKRTRFFRKKS